MDSLIDQNQGLIKRFGRGVRRAGRAIAPGRRAWRGAAWGALIALTLILLVTAYGLFGQTDLAWFLIGAPLFLAAFALAGGFVTLIWRVLKSIPAFYTWVLASAVLVLANLALTALSVPVGIVSVGLGTLALASLVGAGFAALARGGWSRLTWPRRATAVGGLALGLVGLIAGGAWLLDDGAPLTYPINAAAQAGAQVEPLALPDPSHPGPYGVRTLFYGSGADRHRPEYGADVDLLTQPVDGSALVERWSALRTVYWGFGPEALPLNARVWVPEPVLGESERGEELFPLVLIVHGQHPMEDFSDAGYAYLGEMLASRGFIVASVDQNFLNLSPLADLVMLQSLIEPDDLRGWLLLEHLQLWREWNGQEGSPFYQKVDIDQIALIGHSRGGQAVAVADAFNELPYYPDNASIRFNYHFGIRSVVAFAPVDGGYLPAEQEIVLNDVNYLVLHGAHDMDVFTFQGDRQYSRVRFTGNDDRFKAAVYIYGANHGQFNTEWGRKDLFEPVMRIFNLEQLMPGEQQRQIARVTIGAFLEATLHGESGYRALFQDLRRGRAWLPDTIYLHQYQDSTTRLVSTYEEDIDLASTTLPGGSLDSENLTIWREQPAQAKWQDLGDQAVYLGWDAEGGASPASYRIRIPGQGLPLTRDSILVFALADAGEEPAAESTASTAKRNGLPVDLTVEVMDSAGQTSRLPLRHFAPLQPPLKGQLGKARFMSPFPEYDTVLQHFEFPLADFVATNPAFDPVRTTQVRLLFDRTKAGVVVLDNVGFRLLLQ